MRLDFNAFFTAATGHSAGPFGYQRRLACGERQPGEPEADWFLHGTGCASRLISIPTGLGKTAGVVLGLRTLVEQTAATVKTWLSLRRLRPLEFQTDRSYGKGRQGGQTGAAFKLTFPTAIPGPLALHRPPG